MNLSRKPSPLFREINGAVKDILKDQKKEAFFSVIRLSLPATEKNHEKYRLAMVETLQHLREMNIRSDINYGDDSLGKFYETFLKYANGAKEMGIVLTPRHITKFAVDVVGIGPNDKVFDPACGTGGFLVSALDTMRKTCGNKLSNKAFDIFKENCLFGVEQRDDIYALALVNMIFRGDGKSNIYDGNCFDHDFWERDKNVTYRSPGAKKLDGAQKPFTKVLMNPPFKLEGSPEARFVDYALSQMKPGGTLFAVLPARAMAGKSFAQWRIQLLKRHSIKAVIKFDKNLFYPVQEGTYGLIVKAHKKHNGQAKVFMGILHDDKQRPRRSKMLSEHDIKDNVEEMTDDLRRFLSGRVVKKSNVPRAQVITAIRPSQAGEIDFSPEAYLDAGAPMSPPDFSSRSASLVYAKIETSFHKRHEQVQESKGKYKLSEFHLADFVKEWVEPPLSALKNYNEGDIPVVTATHSDNGINCWKDIPPALRLSHCISISKTHNTKPCQAFWHPYEFSAINTVILFRPIDDFSNISSLLFLCQSITDNNAWRYDYARPVIADEIKIYLPSKRGKPDMDAILAYGKRILTSTKKALS